MLQGLNKTYSKEDEAKERSKSPKVMPKRKIKTIKIKRKVVKRKTSLSPEVEKEVASRTLRVYRQKRSTSLDSRSHRLDEIRPPFVTGIAPPNH